jgi:hypothetical protein
MPTIPTLPQMPGLYGETTPVGRKRRKLVKQKKTNKRLKGAPSHDIKGVLPEYPGLTNSKGGMG